jgi:flagellin-like hook-associated protein FlgL
MAASYSALNMKRANNLLTKSLQRLSSGKRITSPSDDAGGLAVGMKIQSALKRAAASRLNTQNGTSFLQMQDGVLKVAGEILDRMAELKSFYNDVSKSDLDRDTYNHEFKELQTELNMLKGQKFNGVSLFATTQGDNNPLKIITSDDGLGEHVQLQRNGLFENFKSKFGADGRLNTGSHGEYRQVVGEFTRDGGLSDATPGYTSRAYSEGDVIYKQGASEASSGYFMALSDILPGAKIQDTSGATSLWIRLADQNGKGFAEAYPHSPVYDHTNLKFNAEGEEVAYLKGETVKIPAHWASKGSYIFLRAQADIPRGVDLATLFDNKQVGPNGLFDYVGSERTRGATSDGKPLTEFLRTNADLPMPSLYTDGSASELANIMQYNMRNGMNPGYVLSNDGNIYAPSGDWGAELWSPNNSYVEGELVLNTAVTMGQDPRIEEITPMVKGKYYGGSYNQGEFVFAQSEWFKAESAINGDIASVPAVFNSSNPFSAGENVNAYNSVSLAVLLTATDRMTGTANFAQELSIGNVVFQGGSYFQLANMHRGQWSSGITGVSANDTVLGSDGSLYQFQAGGDSSVMPSNDGVNWVSINNSGMLVNNAAFFDVSAAVAADAELSGAGMKTATNAAWNRAGNPTGTYFTRSAWQYEAPTSFNGGMYDKTEEFTNVGNTAKWTKTHYTHLQTSTVGTSYTRGDNIYYQGKNYIYTSNLPSDNPLFSSSQGYTEFGDLLARGAVREVPMYIDTIGGGGASSLPAESYFRPNEDLKFVDRLPSGEVRTTSAARRTDSPLPPGDEIFNSADDAFFGGLQAGNDGLYGTADDYYEAMAFEDRAKASPHVDADADNNKNLLDANNGLADFSVADFVDFIQTLANVRAVNGGTMSRLGYAERILEENEINLGAARSRIMDTDMALESTRMARQNVLVQAAASMVSQANSLNNVVLSLLQ